MKFLVRLFARFRKPMPAKALKCSCCGKAIHRFDKYRIVEAVHRNCADPKLVGQMALEMEEK